MYHNFKILVQKIVKNKCCTEQIIHIIFDNNLSTAEKIVDISNIVFPPHSKIFYGVSNKSHVATKINNYIRNKFPNIFNTSFPTIADIGGGNGNLLQDLSDKIPDTRMICIESESEWSEPYQFSCPNVDYLLWNGRTNFFSLNAHVFNVVIASVSLHHMTNETLNQLMSNIQTTARPYSILIIKEHDCTSPNDHNIIDWEHHLYHITQINRAMTMNDAMSYLNSPNVINLKTKVEMDRFIKSYGYIKIDELNRHMEYPTNRDSRNPTKLYWSVYQKSP